MPPCIIRSYTFHISEPYAAGQPLGLAEAQALNSLRAKNLHRSFSPQVAKAEASQSAGLLSQQQVEELQQTLTKLDQAYQLPTKHENGQALRLGLLDQEARAVARERLLQLSQQQPIEPSQEPEMLAKLLATRAVQDEAQRRLQARRSLADQGLEALL